MSDGRLRGAGRPPRLRQRRRPPSSSSSPRNGDTVAARTGAAPRGRPGSPSATSAKARAVGLADGVLTDDAAGVVVAIPTSTSSSRSSAAIEPARTLILDRPQGGQAGRHRQQGAAGHRRRRAVRGGGRRPGVDLLFEAAVAGGIPLIRPLRESLAGERIIRVMGIVNGTTNFILTRMTEDGHVLRRRPGRGPGPGLRRARPDRRRRGLRRRGQGRHHRQHRLRRRRRGRRRLPRGHQRRHRRRHRLRRPPRLRGQAAGHRRCGAEPGGDEVAVRVHPAMVPTTHPLAVGARVVQRRVHRGRGRRRADVLRPGRRRHAHAPAPCSATSSTPPTTCAAGGVGRGRRRSAAARHPAHRRAARRSTT